MATKRQPIKLIPRYIDDPGLIVVPIEDNNVYDEIGIDKNLPQHPALLYVPGPPMAGKSTLIQWLLAVPYNMFFNKIFIISATIHKDISWQKFKFEGTRVYEQYSDEIMRNIVSEIENSEDEKCLIIIDDMTGQDIFSGRSNELVKFIPVHRHSPKKLPPNVCGTSLWIMSHQYVTIQKRIRGLMSDLVIFALRSDEELEAIAQDCKGLKLNYNEFKQLYLDATKEPFSFLYIQKKNKVDPFRIGFNIVMEEQHDENKIEDNNI